MRRDLPAWQQRVACGAHARGGEVVAASAYRALENQVRELQRMLSKKTMENEILRKAISRVADPNKAPWRALVAGGRLVSAVVNALGVSRQHLSSARRKAATRPAAGPHCRRRSSSRVSGP